MSCNEIVFYCRNASHEDDEYEAMKATEAKNYYALAHTVREDINDQASIMVNGRMKEYQVCAVYLCKDDTYYYVFLVFLFFSTTPPIY